MPMMSSFLKASNTGKIKPAKVPPTLLAVEVPCADDVVEGEQFPVIKASVAVAVKFLEQFWIINNPVVASLLEEFIEHGVADLACTVS